MKLIALMLMVPVLVSCGTDNPLDYIRPHEKKLEINSAFRVHVDAFVDDWSRHFAYAKIDDLVLDFDHMKPGDNGAIVLGRCYRNKKKTPKVLIDPDRWTRLTETSKRSLIYHELGHCVLNRSHVDGTNSSIMNPNLISDSSIRKNRDRLLAELFNPDAYNSWMLLTGGHMHSIECNH